MWISSPAQVSTFSEACIKKISPHSYKLLLRERDIIGICHVDVEKSIKNIRNIQWFSSIYPFKVSFSFALLILPFYLTVTFSASCLQFVHRMVQHWIELQIISSLHSYKNCITQEAIAFTKRVYFIRINCRNVPSHVLASAACNMMESRCLATKKTFPSQMTW